jgi:tRNA pseudouridine-54 N-methylase
VIGEGTKARLRFLENIKQIEPGATLKRQTLWTVEHLKRFDTSVQLVLRSQVNSRKTIRVNVMTSHWGPDLANAGLQSVKSAPRQLTLAGTT